MNDVFLVTLCNTRGETLLVRFEPNSGVSPVPLPKLERALGATGCVRWKDKVVVAIQRHPATFAILNSALEFITYMVVEGIQDAHALLLHEDLLLVVSTGTNQVFRLDTKFEVKGVFEVGEPALIDKDHLNDLCLADGRVIASCFGPRRPNGLRNGRVFDLQSGETLFEGFNDPHSVTWSGRSLHVLDSGTGRLFRLDPYVGPKRMLAVNGYSRGLYMDAETIVVGKSRIRADGRKTPFQHAKYLFSSEAVQDEFNAAGLFVFNRANETSVFHSVETFGPEIYQILPFRAGQAGSE